MRSMRFFLIPAALLLAGSVIASDTTGMFRDGSWRGRIRKDHPRLFFNREMLPGIRAYAKAHPELVRELKRYADKLPDDAPYIELSHLFTRDPATGQVTPKKKSGGAQGSTFLKYEGGKGAARCALLYVLTQDPKYKEKAVRYLKLYHKELDFSRYGNWWLDLGGNTRTNAMFAYDVLYNDLTPEQRKELILPVLQYVKDTQPGARFKFRRTIGSYRDGNYGEPSLEYFMGVTLYGDGIADADAAAMLQRGSALFVKMLKFRDEISAGSGLLSALTAGYAFGLYPLATHLFFYSVRSAFNTDISGEWTQMLNYHRFAEGMTFLPDEKGSRYLYGIGDLWHTDNRVTFGAGMYSHVAHNIHFYGKKYPEKAAEMYHFLATVPPEQRIVGGWLYPVLPFLATGFDPAKVQPGPAADIPYFYTPRFGFLSAWSGRGKDDTYMSFRFGADQSNHQHYDDLSFVIYKHGFLAIDSGSRTETYHHHCFGCQTVAHNSLLIHMENEPMASFWHSWSYKPDGKTYFCHGGQNRKDSGKALALQSGRDFLYAAGDGTRNYSKGKCREAVRQFVYLKPDIFVIYDRVESVRPNQKKEFLLHTLNRPVQLESGFFQADAGKGRLFMRTLLPADAVLHVEGGPDREFRASGQNWPLDNYFKYDLAGKWRIEVMSPKSETSLRFLHVLQAADTGVSAPFPASYRAKGEEDVVTVNRTELRFHRTGKVGLRIRKTDANGKVLWDQALPNKIEKRLSQGSL